MHLMIHNKLCEVRIVKPRVTLEIISPVDSLHHYKQGGQWRSLDDFSRASTPHESPIVSEEANDFVYYPKAAEGGLMFQLL